MKIALLGYGVEGASAHRYFSLRYPNAEFEIYDNAEKPKYEIPKGIVFRGGVSDFHDIDADIVMRTPAIPPYAVSSRGKISSVTQEFFEACSVPIIGVTGTKGKGTTANLIVAMFNKAGIKTWLVGNIGVSSLDILDEVITHDASGNPGVVMYELSSFQLWDMKKSPHVAVVLPIEPDHLNVHADFDEYVAAKSNIRRFQQPDDLCVYNPSNVYSVNVVHTSDVGKSMPYGDPNGDGVYARDGSFYQLDHAIAPIEALQLVGQHNIDNACAAITVARFYDISDAAIDGGLRDFKGLPHRIEFVRELDGIKYYNDSFSTAPSATIAAIRSFTQPEVLILGGTDKGSDYSGLIDEISSHANIKAIVVMGEIRSKLANLLRDRLSGTIIDSTDLTKLSPIVDLARSYASSGDVIVLTPACASFDMFHNVYDRGDQFRAIVNNL